jgi:hypothetical protein
MSPRHGEFIPVRAAKPAVVNFVKRPVRSLLRFRSIHPGGGVRSHPVPVRNIFRVGDDVRLFLAAVNPAVCFGMSIREGESTAGVVVSPRRVAPDGVHHVEGERSVV